MKRFAYKGVCPERFSAQSRELCRLIREDKGRLAALRQAFPRAFADLEAGALFDGVQASAHLEGIYLDEGQVQALVAEVASPAADAGTGEGARPADDEEAQVAGYARALVGVLRGPVDAGAAGAAGVAGDGCAVRVADTADLLALHGALFSHRPDDGRSRYRRRDHVRTMVDGRLQPVRVSPVPAFETPLYLGAACDSLAEALAAGGDVLVLAPVVTVDVLCIRPFDEGTGRVARLFAEKLLVDAGFDVARFAAPELLFERDAARYYDALNACVEGWERNANTYEPYVRYWLETLHAAYTGLFEKVGHLSEAVVPGGRGMADGAQTGGEDGATGDAGVSGARRTSKAERVRRFFEGNPGAHTKQDVLAGCGDVAVSTVELALGQLVRDGVLRKVGGGRSTAYEWACSDTIDGYE